jgi:hypothetical protein
MDECMSEATRTQEDPVTPCYDLAHLSDEELLQAIERLERQCNLTLANLLAHLAEVDRRRLHLRFGHSSLFSYCTERLALSEAEAYLRICAARAAVVRPELLGMIADGTMHLSGIKLLSAFLDGPEAEQLIAAARGKSKRAIEELLPSLLPEPRASQVIRKLPEPRGESSAPAGKGTAAGTGSLPLLTPRVLGSVPPSPAAPVSAVPVPPSPAASVPPAEARGPAEASIPAATLAAPPAPAAGPGTSAVAPGPPPAASRYQVQIVVGAGVRDKLRQAQELLRHQVPDGDLGVVLERALDLLIAQQRKQRFGTGARPRRSAPAAAQSAPAPAAPVAGRATDTGSAPTPALGPTSPEPQAPAAGAGEVAAERDTEPMPRSRHISLPVRREVHERDGERCTFVGIDGRRCTEQGMLELHHEEPFARGGAHSVENVRLLCRAHNAFLAELDYGEDAMRRHRERRAGAPPAAGATGGAPAQ